MPETSILNLLADVEVDSTTEEGTTVQLRFEHGSLLVEATGPDGSYTKSQFQLHQT